MTSCGVTRAISKIDQVAGGFRRNAIVLRAASSLTNLAFPPTFFLLPLLSRLAMTETLCSSTLDVPEILGIYLSSVSL
jgi:hypothetical protein